MKALTFAGAAASLLTVAACASIIEGTNQTITLNTNPPGADCALTREAVVIGRIAPTPGSVVIQKTKHDITITCAKEGYQEATYLNHSGAAGATFGNIVLGGGIGWAIDSASGADNKYDSPVNITLVPMQTPVSVQGPTAPAANWTKSPALGGATVWNVGGVDVCGQPWSMKLQALDGKLNGGIVAVQSQIQRRRPAGSGGSGSCECIESGARSAWSAGFANRSGSVQDSGNRGALG
jgi:hypothetical protein